MAVATAPNPVSAAQANDSLPLFGYEVSKGGRTIMELIGLAGEGSEVRVEAEIYPLSDRGRTEPERRSHTFPTREQAMRFVDETVIAFEYLSCAVSMTGH